MKVEKEEKVVPRPGVKLTEADADLFDVLKAHRFQLAKEGGIPAYMVFSNATLQEMAKKRPTTITDFKKVSGVGTLKATWYGESFLEAIRNYLDEQSYR